MCGEPVQPPFGIEAFRIAALQEGMPFLQWPSLHGLPFVKRRGVSLPLPFVVVFPFAFATVRAEAGRFMAGRFVAS